MHLGDGTEKIFLNMSSKNGTPALISLLQYMKQTQLDNPEILVRDSRIVTLDAIVTEVKQSEEWEAVRMSILEIGIEQGIEQGLSAFVEICREFKITREETRMQIQQKFHLSPENAEERLKKYWKDNKEEGED